jgi:hypothetical protein
VLADSFDADNDPLFYAGDKVGCPLFTRIMSQDISLQFFHETLAPQPHFPHIDFFKIKRF